MVPLVPLQARTLQTADFELIDELGEGSYSTVYRAQQRVEPHGIYAMKVISKEHVIREKKAKYVKIERDTLQRMSGHPGIVSMFSAFQDVRNLYFVLELAPNGDMLQLLQQRGSFDLATAQYYAAQILYVLGGMHDRGVIHRDLKPENVLLDKNWNVKITDFGCAKLTDTPKPITGPIVAHEGLHRSFVGTPEYVSPEVLENGRTTFKESDFWALGCIVYHMITGKPPFKAATEYLTFQKIRNLDYTFPEGFYPQARAFVESVLIYIPQERPQITEQKLSPFFRGITFDADLWHHSAPSPAPGLVSAPSNATNNRLSTLFKSGISSATSTSSDGEINDDEDPLVDIMSTHSSTQLKDLGINSSTQLHNLGRPPHAVPTTNDISFDHDVSHFRRNASRRVFTSGDDDAIGSDSDDDESSGADRSNA